MPDDLIDLVVMASQAIFFGLQKLSVSFDLFDKVD